MQTRPWHASYPAGIPLEIKVDEHETLMSMIAASIDSYSDRPAVTCLGEVLNYKDLGELSSALAAYFQMIGLAKGDRVALMMPNCLAYPLALIAALQAGCAVVNINPLYTPREIEHLLQDSGAKCILVGQYMLASLDAVFSKSTLQHIVTVPVSKLLYGMARTLAAAGLVDTLGNPGIGRHISLPDAISAGSLAVVEAVKVTPDDIAFLQYTGGTTGVSKGAILTHGAVRANTVQLDSCDLVAPDERIEVVNPLPLYHIYPLAVFLLAFARGGNNRLIQNPRDPATVIAELKRAPFDTLIGINTLFNGLVDHPELANVDFSRTRKVTGAGASIQRAVAARWEAAGGPSITEAYGLTETSPGVTFNPPGRNGTIGMPIPSTDVLIVDADGAPVQDGESGELLIKGPQVFSGYWNRPDETRNAFTKDGWFKTGDVVYMDKAGFMYLVDRKKDMILVSGFNVYPNEIEAVVAMLPDVLECACIGVADERSGEAPHLFVVRRIPDLTAAEIEAHCRANLAAYKIPRHFTFVESLPKSTVGKILRKDLLTKLQSAPLTN